MPVPLVAAERWIDAQALGVAAPLDALRLRVLKALGPITRTFAARRDERVALTAAVVIPLALAFTLTVPLWQLALSPLLFGALHILGDLRYLVARQGFHLRPAVVLWVGGPLLAVAFGAETWVGLLAPLTASLLARGSVGKRALTWALSVALVAVALSWKRPFLLFFAHAHNLVAVALWWAWRGRPTRLQAVPLVLFLLAWGGLLLGVYDPLIAWLGTADWGLGAVTMDRQMRALGRGFDEVWARRLVLSFAVAQSVHYWVWFRLIPEDDRSRPTPRTFRSTWRAARRDMGTWLLLGAMGATLLLVGWAVLDLHAARWGYLRFVRFHGSLELAAAVLLWVEGNRSAGRGRLTSGTSAGA